MVNGTVSSTVTDCTRGPAVSVLFETVKGIGTTVMVTVTVSGSGAGAVTVTVTVAVSVNGHWAIHIVEESVVGAGTVKVFGLSPDSAETTVEGVGIGVVGSESAEEVNVTALEESTA